MSKGSRVVTLRLTPELETQVLAAIGRANNRTQDEPYGISTWIAKAIREKLDHLNRKPGRKKDNTLKPTFTQIGSERESVADASNTANMTSQPIGYFGEEQDPCRPNSIDDVAPTAYNPPTTETLEPSTAMDTIDMFDLGSNEQQEN